MLSGINEKEGCASKNEDFFELGKTIRYWLALLRQIKANYRRKYPHCTCDEDIFLSNVCKFPYLQVFRDFYEKRLVNLSLLLVVGLGN